MAYYPINPSASYGGDYPQVIYSQAPRQQGSGMPSLPFGSMMQMGGLSPFGGAGAAGSAAGWGPAAQSAGSWVTGGAASGAGAGGSGLGGAGFGAGMINPYTAIAAIVAGLSAGSLSKGHDNQDLNTFDNLKQTFGGEGWGGPPMMAFQEAFDGDFKGAMRQIGGTDPGGIMNPIGTLAGGGNLEDVGKNMIAPLYNLKDIGKNRDGKGSNAFLDIIKIFSGPGMARD